VTLWPHVSASSTWLLLEELDNESWEEAMLLRVVPAEDRLLELEEPETPDDWEGDDELDPLLPLLLPAEEEGVLLLDAWKDEDWLLVLDDCPTDEEEEAELVVLLAEMVAEEEDKVLLLLLMELLMAPTEEELLKTGARAMERVNVETQEAPEGSVAVTVTVRLSTDVGVPWNFLATGSKSSHKGSAVVVKVRESPSGSRNVLLLNTNTNSAPTTALQHPPCVEMATFSTGASLVSVKLTLQVEGALESVPSDTVRTMLGGSSPPSWTKLTWPCATLSTVKWVTLRPPMW
jgi:hypothetical protein